MEDYVSFELAKLLKEKGFNMWCYKSYGTAVYHKGVPISFDEECELKDAGLEDEIEYVEGGHLYDFGCNNGKEDVNVYAAPTLQRAMKWLRTMYNILLVVDYEYECTSTSYYFKIYRLGKNGKPDKIVIEGVGYKKDGTEYKHPVGYRDYKRSSAEYETYEKAAEAGLKYCLEKELDVEPGLRCCDYYV